MMDVRQAMQARMRTAAIIWVAFLATVFVYWGLVIHLGRGQQPAPLTNAGPIHLILLGVAVLMFFTAGAIRTIMLRSPLPQVDGGSGDAAVTAALNRLVTVTVVCAAVGESIAILGLVEFFLLRADSRFVVFLLLSLGTLILYMPRASQWRTYLSRQVPDIGFPTE